MTRPMNIMTSNPAFRLAQILAGICLTIAMLSTLTGCEEEVDADLPFEERLVVEAYIQAGMPADTILLTRTMPVNVRYDPFEAAITDGSGEIVADNGEVFPLVHAEGPRYYAQGLTVSEGMGYRLNVRWREFSATAHTVVPHRAEIVKRDFDSLTDRFGDGRFYFHQTIIPEGSTAYGLSFFALDQNQFVREIDGYLTTQPNGDYGYYTRVLSKEDSPGRDSLEMYLVSYYSPSYLAGNLVWVETRAYDHAYNDYLRSRDDFNNDDNPLAGTRTPRRWNVTGDGLGLFLGFTSRVDTLVR